MITATVRVSMNVTEFVLAVGFAFAAGFFAAIWVRR